MEMRKQVLAVTIGVLLVLSVFSVLRFWQIKPVQATTVFNNSFEEGQVNPSPGLWTGNSTSSTSYISVISTDAHAGTYSLNCSQEPYTGNDNAYKDLGGSKSEVYARMYIKFLGLIDISGWSRAISMMRFTDENTYTVTVAVKQYYDGSNVLWALQYHNASAFVNVASGSVISTDVWYFVQVYFKAGAGNGNVTLWVDGTQLLSYGDVTSNGQVATRLAVGPADGSGPSVRKEYHIDSVVVDDSAYIGSDGTATNSYGATASYAGVSSTFYSFWIAVYGQTMSYSIFSSNNTGSVVNDTAVAFSTEWANTTKTLNAVVGVVQWQIFTNDSSGDEFTTGLQNLTTTYPSPLYSSILLIGQKAGQASHLNIKWTAVTGTTLNTSILCWNSTGPFTNTSFALSGSPAWHNFTGTANSTVGNVIVAWFYANNTLNQWTRTANVTFVTYADTMALHAVGTQLKDDTNATIILKGLDYTYFIDGPLGSWMGATGNIEWNTWNETALNETLTAMQGWGANCIRVLATSEWWLEDSSGFRAKLQTFISSALDRGIYVAFTFWRNNGSEGQVAIPYSDAGNGQIESQADFISMWASIITTLRNNSNVIFEPWNEPTASATWYSVSQQIINYARNYTASIVVYGGPILGVDFDNYLGGSIWTMGYAETYPANDTINNILYTGHFYRNCFYYGSSGSWQAYNYENMTWALEQISVTNFTAGPLWIGELGYSNWASDLVNETAWFNNTLSILNTYGVGFCDWAAPPWVTGTEWGIVQGGQANYVLTAAGNILKAAMQTLIPPTVTVTLPEASTYSASIPVSFSASGGTIDDYWFNALNGSTWVYVSNQTYAGSGTVYMTGFVVGSYTGYFWANNTAGNIGQATVTFSVSISGGIVELIVNTWWSGYW